MKFNTEDGLKIQNPLRVSVSLSTGVLFLVEVSSDLLCVIRLPICFPGGPTSCIHELSPSSNPEAISIFCFNVCTKVDTCSLSLMSGGRKNSNTYSSPASTLCKKIAKQVVNPFMRALCTKGYSSSVSFVTSSQKHEPRDNNALPTKPRDTSRWRSRHAFKKDHVPRS
ncbi:hypothetical protein Hdeb2414_s0005g00183181 [Helianthus debilis subsp. tardiflorus]